VVPVLVDCTDRGTPKPLAEKYGVRGLPTMLFLDSDGTVVSNLEGRDPASVAAKISMVAGATGGDTGEHSPPPMIYFIGGGLFLLVLMIFLFKKINGD
jgi:hypothetical protein